MAWSQLDWSKLPDIAAIAALACAFASVLRRNRMAGADLWLAGWLMIMLHFTALLLLPVGGWVETAALILELSSLTWAGTLFMWTTVPYRKLWSSRLVFTALLLGNTVSLALLVLRIMGTPGIPRWPLDAAAIFLGSFPLLATLPSRQAIRFTLRWVVVSIYLCLGVVLLVLLHRSPPNLNDAINAILCTVYLGATLHFFVAFRPRTTGAVITIGGFFAWAAVFILCPLTSAYAPNLHLENEVWNLPKYVVAIGMILLLLEDQIAYNRHLALHDDLTGLPNRRLLQDRLNGAIERARREQTHMAVLVIDIDRFKLVNDTLGHHCGDLLLQRITNLFRERVRRTDTLARSGGDEFTLILDQPVSREDAEQVAASLHQILNQKILLGDHWVQVGASIGIAIFPEDGEQAEALCIAADLRMYEAKSSGAARLLALQATSDLENAKMLASR